LGTLLPVLVFRLPTPLARLAALRHAKRKQLVKPPQESCGEVCQPEWNTVGFRSGFTHPIERQAVKSNQL